MDIAMVVLGTSTGRQVHLAWDFNQKPLCGKERITNLISGPIEGGHDDTLATVLGASIAPSRLCCLCFYPKFRMIYRKVVAEKRS